MQLLHSLHLQLFKPSDILSLLTHHPELRMSYIFSCRSYRLFLTVKVNHMGDGVNSPSFWYHSPLLPPPFSVPNLCLCPCLPIFFPNSPSPLLFPFLSAHPLHHSLKRVCTHPYNMNMSLFSPLCYSVFITNSLYRSAMAMHCCGVPVHPPAGHRRHPHVHRGVSLW